MIALLFNKTLLYLKVFVKVSNIVFLYVYYQYSIDISISIQCLMTS